MDTGGELSLDSLLEQIGARLTEAAALPASPFRTAVLATADDNGPQARTVVLRRFDASSRTLCCHTDARSTKAAHMAAGARVQWLFYDPARRIQIRLSGEARVLDRGSLVDALWANASARSRRDFRGRVAPGTPLPSPHGQELSLHHEGLEARPGTFVAVESRYDAIDWLQLGDTEHTRARFTWSVNALTASWVAP